MAKLMDLLFYQNQEPFLSPSEEDEIMSRQESSDPSTFAAKAKPDERWEALP